MAMPCYGKLRLLEFHCAFSNTVPSFEMCRVFFEDFLDSPCFERTSHPLKNQAGALNDRRPKSDAFCNRNATSCPNTDSEASLIANADAVTQETETYYYHADHLGSIGIVTKNGELYDYSVFLPFGEQWVYQSQNDAALNQGVNGEGLNPLSPFQFTGKELDKYTGLTYFGARYYDPHL